MKAVKTIVMIGVGGQGTILVSRVLTRALMNAGYDVKMSEVHGMSQRGGSVQTQVRYGDKVYSPLVGLGGADVLVAFEKMEAARGVPFLKDDGIVVVNDQEINPLPVAAGALDYPEGILEALAQNFRVIAFNAAEKAQALGEPRTMNIVLLGAMAEAFQMEELDFESALRETVPPHTVDVNLRAFAAGRALGRGGRL